MSRWQERRLTKEDILSSSYLGVRVHRDTLPTLFSQQCRCLLGFHHGLANHLQTIVVTSLCFLHLNNPPWIIYVMSAVELVIFGGIFLTLGTMVSLSSRRLLGIQFSRNKRCWKWQRPSIRQTQFPPGKWGVVISPIEVVLSSVGVTLRLVIGLIYMLSQVGQRHSHQTPLLQLLFMYMIEWLPYNWIMVLLSHMCLLILLWDWTLCVIYLTFLFTYLPLLVILLLLIRFTSLFLCLQGIKFRQIW